jgi:hypothetical protein
LRQLNISEEHITSFFRVGSEPSKKLAEVGSKLKLSEAPAGFLLSSLFNPEN